MSSIAARFINYLLTPLLTYNLAHREDYGKIGLIYSAIPILNIVFTYGFETAYFRFAGKDEHKEEIYSTASLSLLFSTILFTVVLWIFRGAFGAAIGLSNFPAIIQISIFIIALDALSTIPFARLRQEQRPVKYAFIKIANILINIIVTWFYIVWCPRHVASNDNSFFILIYSPHTNPVVYVVLANLLASAFTLVLLANEIKQIKFRFNTVLWKQMIIYSMPLIIAGMGGMINETFDMKFFVITVCCVFLIINLYIPVWRYFIDPGYWEGLGVVPILVLANMCLGIYYNLSIWYKLSHKTTAGAIITLTGAGITFLINWLFIPRFSYMASAWATFACYSSMMVLSFVWGQKAYYVPYAWKKLLAYIAIVILLFFLHKGITAFVDNTAFSLVLSTILTTAFILFVVRVEKKEFQQMPVVGRYVGKYIR